MNGRAASRKGGFTGMAERALLIATIGLGLGAATMVTGARAQAPDIDWGGDTSAFANDRECDDPRFEGPGMAKILDDANIGADASDCFDQFKRGRIVLRADAPPVSAAATELDFGDDTGRWANDGECDDPRFEGEGMAAVLVEEDRLRDATDCRTLFERGAIALRGDAAPPASATPAAPATSAIDFGDDTGRWANDGECDDPRFEGEGMAAVLVDEDRLRDATDCRTLFEAGSIALRDDAAPTAPAAPAIDFGDDTGRWANDGECDDPRFEGEGMAAVLVDEDRLRDATDCRRLYEAGSIALRGGAPSPAAAGQPAAPGRADASRIDFGDDTGRWANDGECDDPRFEGEGMAAVLVEDDRFRDATDCRRLYQEGAIDLIGEARADIAPDAPAAPVAPAAPAAAVPPVSIDFGDDSSRWANDGECDDPRFEGEGMAFAPVEEDRLRDATDCSRALAEGRIRLK